MNSSINNDSVINKKVEAKHPLSCRCGTVRGFITAPEHASRGLCYCTDCQAFAHFLNAATPPPPTDILDAAGGTQIVATQPRYVHFTQGFDAVVCMSLTENGLLRWYAGCCNTPIGNTPRDRKVAYIGLLHNCLVPTPEDLPKAFGPVRVVLNTKTATAPMSSTPIKNLFAILSLGKKLMSARLTKSYMTTPFFNTAGEPVKAVRVLSAVELNRLKGAM